MTAVHGMGDLPEKSVLLIEEDTGVIKSFYAQYLAAESASIGKSVSYVTSENPENIRRQMSLIRIPLPAGLHIHEFPETDAASFLEFVTTGVMGDLIIVEQFSTYFLDAPASDLKKAVSRISASAKSGKQYILLIDRGVLPGMHEAVLRALADGVIQITTLTEGDKIKRYLNIPKMRGVRPLEKMLPFTVTDEGFLIDTRERHG